MKLTTWEMKSSIKHAKGGIVKISILSFVSTIERSVMWHKNGNISFLTLLRERISIEWIYTIRNNPHKNSQALYER